MEIIINFLSDAAKIVFGSAVVGFFIPGLSDKITWAVLLGGVGVTAGFLTAAVSLSKRLKQSKTL
ncbi:MAG: hypothetical protein AAB415_02245 [Patescibacteria group bacterium]